MIRVSVVLKLLPSGHLNTLASFKNSAPILVSLLISGKFRLQTAEKAVEAIA